MLLRQAFKNYDEAGSLRRIQCLKYLVLATMLMESDVDPFDAQEAKPYRQDPDVLAMTNLVDAYQRNNIAEFEKTLKNNRRTSVMDDPFISNYIEDLLKNIRTQVSDQARRVPALFAPQAAAQPCSAADCLIACESCRLPGLCLRAGGPQTHSALHADQDTLRVTAAQHSGGRCRAAAGVADPGQPDQWPHRSGERREPRGHRVAILRLHVHSRT